MKTLLIFILLLLSPLSATHLTPPQMYKSLRIKELALITFMFPSPAAQPHARRCLQVPILVGQEFSGPMRLTLLDYQ